MKLKTKIITVVLSGSIVISGAIVALTVNNFKNYESNQIATSVYNSLLKSKKIDRAKVETPTKEEPVVENEIEKPQQDSEVIENKDVKQPINTQPKNEVKIPQERPRINPEIKSPPKKVQVQKPKNTKAPKIDNFKPSSDSELDNVLNQKTEYDDDLGEIEIVNEVKIEKNLLPIDQELGGYGTKSRKKVRRFDGQVHDNPFMPGAQESSQTMVDLYYSGVKFKKLAPGVKVKSEDFKFVKPNSMVYTGEEFLEITNQDLEETVKEMNRDMYKILANEKDPNYAFWKQWHKEKGDFRVSSLRPEEIKMLRQGWFPSSINSWSLRPGFVNPTVYKTTRTNLNRYIPLASSSERSATEVHNLSYNPGKEEQVDPKFNWNKKTQNITGYTDNVAQLHTYTNGDGEERYILEVKNLNEFRDIQKAVNTVLGVVKNKAIGIGVAVRNINNQTVDEAKEIVKNIPNTVKSLNLFYQVNDPEVVNALLENKNFSSKNPLFELDIIVGNLHDENSPKLNQVDPRVFIKVKPSTFDYHSSAIFTRFTIANNINKSTLENLLKYVYIKERNRREFQGSFGQGGHITEINLAKTEITDFNNIDFPKPESSDKLIFTQVVFGDVKNQKVNIDLSDLRIDNTDKINPRSNWPVLYGLDISNQPHTLTLTARSNRSIAQDIATLVNIYNYSHAMKTIDLSSVNEFTEANVKPALSGIRNTVKVITASGEFSFTPPPPPRG
ncbi:IgG-blocking virulence protein [Candidatus Mycoplasma pogonae]